MSQKPMDPFADGRDGRGRFAPGNGGGPGNPHAATVSRLRSALFRAVTEEDIREVVVALVTEAKAGSVPAARELLQRVLGQPEATDVLVRLEELQEALETASGKVQG